MAKLDREGGEKYADAYTCPARRILEDEAIVRQERDLLYPDRHKYPRRRVSVALDAADSLGFRLDYTHASVTRVAEESQADRAGVKVGWRIVAINGERVETRDAYEASLAAFQERATWRLGEMSVFAWPISKCELTFETTDLIPSWSLNQRFSETIKRHVIGRG